MPTPSSVNQLRSAGPQVRSKATTINAPPTIIVFREVVLILFVLLFKCFDFAVR